MSDRHDIRNYDFDPAKQYFVDANVWLYIYGPMTPDDWKAKVYSGALKRLRTSGASVFIDVLVVSEIMNRWSRFEYKRAGGDDRYKSFKEYRTAPAFGLVGAEIVTVVQSILRLAKKTGTPFANVNLDATLSSCAAGTIDLADALICECCRAKPFTLITHDADMKDRGVPIVTANSAILQ